MSETTSTPSENEAPAAPPADSGSNVVADAVSTDTAGATPKKKRKRKRKRKSASGATPSDQVATGASGTTEPHASVAGTAEVNTKGSQRPTRDRKPRQDHKPQQDNRSQHDHGRSRNRRGPEPVRKHRRDAERALRTQELLAGWRWQPSGAILGYFPALVQEHVSPKPEAVPAEDASVNAETAPAEPAVSASEESVAGTAPSDVVSPEAVTDATVTDATVTDATVTDAAVPSPSEATTAEAVKPVVSAPAAARHEPHAPPKWAIPGGNQLGPWLSEALSHCPASERAALLVSLCSHRSFRGRVAQLGAAEQAELRPLAVVYDSVFLDAAPSVGAPREDSAEPLPADAHDAREELRRGLHAVCQGNVEILRAWPLSARERLVELAESFELEGNLQNEAARLFFDAPKLVGRLGLRLVCDALSQGNDAAARDLIKSLGGQPGVPGLLPMLTEALEGQRFGSLVILSYGGAQSRGPDPKAPKRHAGFCLESQRDVWIRTGEGPEAAAFEHYSQVHRRALLPGVVGLYAFGVTRSRKPYAAVLRKGISLQRKLGHGWGMPRVAAVGLATELTLLASGLCRAGLRLPDLDPRRFELDDEGRVWLSDLWGAELMDPKAQDAKAVGVCRDMVVGLLANQPGFTLPSDWFEVLSHSADFETVVATLRKLEKSRFWRS